MEPCRDLPVPFCGRGLRPPPLTSARPLEVAVPRRRSALCHSTTLFTRSGRGGRPHTSDGSSVMPTRGSSHDDTHAWSAFDVSGTAGIMRSRKTSSRRLSVCWNGLRKACGTGTIFEARIALRLAIDRCGTAGRASPASALVALESMEPEGLCRRVAFQRFRERA
eukprot:scaffold67297_cov65-Phaeocystis_antarctica.AAC.2